MEALTYLKKQKNYSPVGEIDKALDLLYREASMNSNRSQQSNNSQAAAGGSGNAVLRLNQPAAAGNGGNAVLKLQAPQAAPP